MNVAYEKKIRGTKALWTRQKGKQGARAAIKDLRETAEQLFRSHEHEVRLPEEESEGWLRHSGIGQLYRGLHIRMGAGLVVFVLSLMIGSDEADAGWAEL